MQKYRVQIQVILISDKEKNIIKKIPKGVPEKLGRTHPKKEIKKINLDEKLGEEIKDEVKKNKREERNRVLDDLDDFLNN